MLQVQIGNTERIIPMTDECFYALCELAEIARDAETATDILTAWDELKTEAGKRYPRLKTAKSHDLRSGYFRSIEAQLHVYAL